MRHFEAPDLQLLIDYAVGECSPADSVLVESWIETNAEARRAFDDVARLYGAARQHGRINVDVQARIRAVESAIDLGAASVKPVERGKSRERVSKYSSMSLPRWVKYGAMAAGLGALAVFSLPMWKSLNPTAESSVDTYTTYTTRAGQLASISLSDGSSVTLGPASALRVRKSQKNILVVEVTGEALFNVNHATKRPFIVNAHGVTTRVLGTEFVVRAYDPSLVRVAVRNGRVSVQSSALTAVNAAIVTAGEAASAMPNTLPTVAPIADFATEFAWADGELVLRDVPLGEAFIRLSRWYNVELRAADPPLLENRVNGTFPRAFNLARMQDLANVIRANMKVSANVLTFSSVQ